MIRPDRGKWRVTQGYHAGHGGVDLAPKPGTHPPLYAPESGTVIAKGHNPALEGRYVLIKSKKYIHYLGHMKQVDVNKGEWVMEGEQVGLVGESGRATGVHVHWEVRNLRNERFTYSPLNLIRKEQNVSKATKSYVKKVYRALLQRDVDSGGLRYYTGKDEGYVFENVYASEEAKRVRAREKRQDEIRAEQARTIKELKKTVENLSARPRKQELLESQAKQQELTEKLQELEKELEETNKELDKEPKHEPAKGSEVEGALKVLINWFRELLK